MEVVDNDGMATLAGTNSPALFTDLTTAQELQKMNGELNTVYYAVDSSHDYEGKIEPVIEQLGLLLNNTLTAQDVGFSLDYQEASDSLTISTDQGLGRISGEKVGALRENLTSLVPQANMLEVLQIPLVELEYQNEQVLTLASKQVSTLLAGNKSLWHFTDSGFGHQIGGDGDAWLWQTDDGQRINDLAQSTTGDYAAVGHSEGIVIGSEDNIDDDYWAEITTTGSIEAIDYHDDSWWVIELNDQSLELISFNLDLSNNVSSTLNLNCLPLYYLLR